MKELLPCRPSYALVLGTGAQRLTGLLRDRTSIEYAEIPYLQPTTAPSHHAQLHIGTLADVPILLLEGRYHYYEGYDMSEITFPIRLLKAIGVDTLLMTNAAGGLLPGMQKSELMLVADHINLQAESPLRGPNLDEYGPRFPDMSAPYDTQLRTRARAAAQRNNIPLREGVYVSVGGPQLETPAEYEYLRRIGGEVVGMSTAPEVIVARHMKMRCCVCSVISDLCYPGALEVIDVPQILAAVAAAEPHLATLLTEIVTEDAASRSQSS